MTIETGRPSIRLLTCRPPADARIIRLGPTLTPGINEAWLQVHDAHNSGYLVITAYESEPPISINFPDAGRQLAVISYGGTCVIGMGGDLNSFRLLTTSAVFRVCGPNYAVTIDPTNIFIVFSEGSVKCVPHKMDDIESTRLLGDELIMVRGFSEGATSETLVRVSVAAQEVYVNTK